MTSFHQPTPSGVAVDNGRPARPRSLRVGSTAALSAGLFGLGGALILILEAKHLAARTASELVGGDTGVLGTELLHQAIADATSTLTTRAVVGMVAAAFMLLVAMAAWNGSLAARVVLVPAVLGSVGANLIAVSDVAGPATVVMDVAGSLLGPVALLGMFLPATGRYAKACRQAAA